MANKSISPELLQLLSTIKDYRPQLLDLLFDSSLLYNLNVEPALLPKEKEKILLGFTLLRDLVQTV